MSNEKQRQQQDEQDMNKKMARSRDQGLHTKAGGERTTRRALALALAAPVDRVMEPELSE